MCWNFAKTAENVTFWTKRKVTEKDGDLEICPPVGQIDHKKVKTMDESLSNAQKLPKISLFERKKNQQKEQRSQKEGEGE